MARLRVWKVFVSKKDGSAKDYWMVPARNLTDAVVKAKKETASDWQLDSVVLVEGDFIMPNKLK